MMLMIWKVTKRAHYVAGHFVGSMASNLFATA